MPVRPQEGDTYPSYSGEVGRWWALDCYRLADGRLLIHEQRFTQWQGEHDFYGVHIFATAEEAADWVEARYPEAAPSFAEELGIVERA